jgi:glycosyltransferase involved in cell wall biosynthesis
MTQPPEQPRDGRHEIPGGDAPRSLYRRARRSIAKRFPGLQRLYQRSEARGYAALARYRHWRDWRRRRPRRRWAATFRWLAATAGALRRRRAESRLTVAVDITPFWEPLTGIGWYLYMLLRHLQDSDEVRIRLYGPSVVATGERTAPVIELPRGPAVEEVVYEVPENLLLSAGLLMRWLRRAERLLIAADGNDVVFAPNFQPPQRLGLARGGLVATVHDLGFRRVPWTLRQSTRRQLAESIDETMLRAVRLITVSAAIRDELAEYGYASPQRVRVVHHGAGQLEGLADEAPPANLPGRFGLHVGTLEPRKNIGRLLEAWRLLGELMEDRPVLVLCGAYGWRTGAIRRQVEAAVAAGWAQHPGYVSSGQLAALYRRAAVVVFPSLYEGFGLPAIEALAAGSPLVCSDIPALREVAGEAALYAPAERPDLLAARLHQALTDAGERQRLATAGRDRRTAFGWTESARRTLAVWREAAGG